MTIWFLDVNDSMLSLLLDPDYPIGSYIISFLVFYSGKSYLLLPWIEWAYSISLFRALFLRVLKLLWVDSRLFWMLALEGLIDPMLDLELWVFNECLPPAMYGLTFDCTPFFFSSLTLGVFERWASLIHWSFLRQWYAIKTWEFSIIWPLYLLNASRLSVSLNLT